MSNSSSGNGHGPPSSNGHGAPSSKSTGHGAPSSNGHGPRIAVVGSGYVGTVVAACFASLGRHVVGLEIDAEKLAVLKSGQAPFHEGGLDDMLAEGLRRGLLWFTDDVAEALDASDVVFLCVGTPSAEDGHADTSGLDAAVRVIGKALRRHHVIVTKSTVPVGTGRRLAEILAETVANSSEVNWPDPHDAFSIVSNPEFLREGSAVYDFLYPDRVVLGSDDLAAIDLVAELYQPILDGNLSMSRSKPALVCTALETAEMIKYASNAFLATKISFANEIANICERVGADVTDVTGAMGLDDRIGEAFLDAGVGWGGSCFGKDVRELAATARDNGYEPEMLHAAMCVNTRQRVRIIDKLEEHLGDLAGRRVGILGLAFKPGTDDLRDAPALDIIRALQERGARLTVHDPMVSLLPDVDDLRYAVEPESVAHDAHAVVLVTDWPEYVGIDLADLHRRMEGDLLVDGRNVFDPAVAASNGLRYAGVGRPSRPAAAVKR